MFLFSFLSFCGFLWIVFRFFGPRIRSFLDKYSHNIQEDFMNLDRETHLVRLDLKQAMYDSEHTFEECQSIIHEQESMTSLWVEKKQMELRAIEHRRKNTWQQSKKALIQNFKSYEHNRCLTLAYTQFSKEGQEPEEKSQSVNDQTLKWIQNLLEQKKT